MDISFKGAIPVIGEKGTLKTVQTELARQISGEYPYELQDVTNIYKNRDKTGLISLIGGQSDCFSRGQLAKEATINKEIGFLLTEKEVNDPRFKHPSWPLRAGSFRYITDNVISLDNLSEAVQKMIELIKSKL